MEASKMKFHSLCLEEGATFVRLFSLVFIANVRELLYSATYGHPSHLDIKTACEAPVISPCLAREGSWTKCGVLEIVSRTWLQNIKRLA